VLRLLVLACVAMHLLRRLGVYAALGPVWMPERRLQTSSSFRWCRLWSLGWQGRRPRRDAVLGPMCVLLRFGCRSGGFGRAMLLSVLSCCLGARVVGSCGTRPRGRCVVSCCIGFRPVFLINWSFSSS
jgi:hypothetical protein